MVNEKKIALMMRLAIIIVAICGVALCWWMSIYLFVVIGLGSFDKPAYLLYAQLASFFIAAVPFFIALIIFWLVSGNVKRKEVFTKKTVKYFSLVVKMLLWDIIIYTVVSVIFYFLLENPMMLCINVFLILVGGAATLVIHLLSLFLKEAVFLQEESDCTI